MRPLLGTFVEIGAEGQDSKVQRAIDEAFAAIEAVHRSLSFQDADSELSRLNRKPGQWIPVSRIVQQVLRLARAMGRASGERVHDAGRETRVLNR